MYDKKSLKILTRDAMIVQAFLIYPLFILSITISFSLGTLQASTYNINEKLVGISDQKTECFTAVNPINDYCKTQMGYKWTLFTGSEYGQLTLALWGGTDQYAHPKGECGLRFNGFDAKGEKGYISDDFTACFFSDELSVVLLAALLEETRFLFYEPFFNEKNRNYSFYTSEMGYLSGAKLTEQIIFGLYLHHIAVSTERTRYHDHRYGHSVFLKASPFAFAKALAKFKYYGLEN